jgi:hypothetical protein
MTHPKDMMIHEGDVWSPYKITRVHNQEGIMEECKIKVKVLRQFQIRRGELTQGSKLLHMGGLVFPSGDFVDRFGATFFGLILAGRETLEFGKVLLRV